MRVFFGCAILLAACAGGAPEPATFLDTEVADVEQVLAQGGAIVYLAAIHDRGSGDAGRFRPLDVYFSLREPVKIADASGRTAKYGFVARGWTIRAYALEPGDYSVRSLGWIEATERGDVVRLREFTPFDPASGEPELFSFRVASGEVVNLGLLVATSVEGDVADLQVRAEDNAEAVRGHILRAHGTADERHLLDRLETRLPQIKGRPG